MAFDGVSVAYAWKGSAVYSLVLEGPAVGGDQSVVYEIIDDAGR